ncbi:hypothetical protein ALO71_200167 [Pseudomonas amygdali pv. dendropanacis]|uniref:DNA-binding protein n=1 Tax=Pseudomonas amygdali pv. dendropanacis TaxID=235272 RepID=A0A0P9TL37_PSEA0|nr:hypothetical protein ALO71_200167 [Pseudomonas amygdali pv. dendropanacis]
MTKQRRTFSTEFKREAAGLVLDQGYSHIEASLAMGGRVCAASLGEPTPAGAQWRNASEP